MGEERLKKGWLGGRERERWREERSGEGINQQGFFQGRGGGCMASSAIWN